MINKNEIAKKGYEDRSDLIDNGAYPTERQDNSYDVHLYAWVAVVALGISQGDREQWIAAYESGWEQRESDCLVAPSGEIIQRFGGFEPDSFGVATQNPQLIEQILQLGAQKKPAHYGFAAINEHYNLNSYILPIKDYKIVYGMLFPKKDNMTILRNHIATLARTSEFAPAYRRILAAIKDCSTKEEAKEVVESLRSTDTPYTTTLEAINDLGGLSPFLRWVEE